MLIKNYGTFRSVKWTNVNSKEVNTFTCKVADEGFLWVLRQLQIGSQPGIQIFHSFLCIFFTSLNSNNEVICVAHIVHTLKAIVHRVFGGEGTHPYTPLFPLFGSRSHFTQLFVLFLVLWVYFTVGTFIEVGDGLKHEKVHLVKVDIAENRAKNATLGGTRFVSYCFRTDVVQISRFLCRMEQIEGFGAVDFTLNDF